jgi:hypothetical protein
MYPIRGYFKTRSRHFSECWKRAKNHWVASVVAALAVAYSAIVEWGQVIRLGNWADVSKWPKLPLPWALVIVLLSLAFIAIEGGYRLQEESKDALAQAQEAARQERTEAEQIFNSEIKDLKIRLENSLASKPEIDSQFDGGKQAVLAVTNNGAIGWVWASLIVNEGTRSPVGPFARWGHSRSFKIQIGKGETHHLLLATLKIENGVTSIWTVHYAMEDNIGTTLAHYSSLIGKTDQGQAPDIHLYVKIFSDPACAELPKGWHVILHSNSAELGA